MAKGIVISSKSVSILLKEVRNKCESKDSTIRGITPTPVPYFQRISEIINEELGIQTINKRWLYDNVYNPLNSKKVLVPKELRLSRSYLDALCLFAFNEPFEDKFGSNFEIERTDTLTLRSRIQSGWFDNEEAPEYPIEYPSFPATPTIPIEVYEFGTIFIKDESKNSRGGTHKSRACWEVLLLAENLLKEIASDRREGAKISFSLISSGSFVLSLYKRLEHYTYIPFEIRCIYDPNTTKKEVTKVLKNLQEFDRRRFKLFPTDLEKEKLNSKRILEITDNLNGYDLTFGEDIIRVKDKYFDWLSYEILNTTPSTVIIPFGSGDLYKGVLDTLKKEIMLEAQGRPFSKRFFGNLAKLKKCKFIGVTTYDSTSPYDKLYSPNHYHPAKSFDLSPYKKDSLISDKSSIVEVSSKYSSEALELVNDFKIDSEPSGIAGLAWFLENKENFSPDEKVLIVNTGRLRLEEFTDIT